MKIKDILLIITAITIVSCNDARKSETYRLLRITDSEDGEFTVRLRCHLKEADEDEIRYCCMEVLGG